MCGGKSTIFGTGPRRTENPHLGAHNMAYDRICFGDERREGSMTEGDGAHGVTFPWHLGPELVYDEVGPPTAKPRESTSHAPGEDYPTLPSDTSAGHESSGDGNPPPCGHFEGYLWTGFSAVQSIIGAETRPERRNRESAELSEIKPSVSRQESTHSSTVAVAGSPPRRVSLYRLSFDGSGSPCPDLEVISSFSSSVLSDICLKTDDDDFVADTEESPPCFPSPPVKRRAQSVSSDVSEGSLITEVPDFKSTVTSSADLNRYAFSKQVSIHGANTPPVPCDVDRTDEEETTEQFGKYPVKKVSRATPLRQDEEVEAGAVRVRPGGVDVGVGREVADVAVGRDVVDVGVGPEIEAPPLTSATSSSSERGRQSDGETMENYTLMTRPSVDYASIDEDPGTSGTAEFSVQATACCTSTGSVTMVSPITSQPKASGRNVSWCLDSVTEKAVRSSPSSSVKFKDRPKTSPDLSTARRAGGKNEAVKKLTTSSSKALAKEQKPSEGQARLLQVISELRHSQGMEAGDSGYSLKDMTTNGLSTISCGIKDMIRFLYVPFQCCHKKVRSIFVTSHCLNLVKNDKRN